MRLSVDIATSDGSDADAELRDVARIEERLRWALGGHAAEVRFVGVRLELGGPLVRCAIHLRLRGRHRLELAADGRSVDDALDFVAHRARAAIARKMDAERISRG
jgi:hypothetical protein